MFLNFFLPRGTLDQLYEYFVAPLDAKIDIMINKQEEPLTRFHGTPVENHDSLLQMKNIYSGVNDQADQIRFIEKFLKKFKIIIYSSKEIFYSNLQYSTIKKKVFDDKYDFQMYVE